ncbi:metabolite interconversion enzyme [Lithospermum erythrorhizon]|uniref:Metabolite interconversion enzyme n=1 Tax=Lithospermum erythrorhizon TaxID=34254 RepID=A0AAV3QN00_LITER
MIEGCTRFLGVELSSTRPTRLVSTKHHRTYTATERTVRSEQIDTMRALMKSNGCRIWFNYKTLTSSNSNIIINIQRNISNYSNNNNSDFGNIIKSPLLCSLDLHDEIWPSKDMVSSTQFGCNYAKGSAGATVLYGNVIAEEIRSKVANEVRKMKASVGEVPGLAVILVGERRDSQSYVRNKSIACEEVGMKFELTELPEHCTTEQVCNAVSYFNKNPSFHGVLVQLPLPKHLDEVRIFDEVCLEKDVDGFHPLNIGSLALCGKEPLFIPCTPKGCIELLLRYNVELMGKHVVVIGRSNIVGVPLSLILQRHHATVSILHAYSSNPEIIAREADILIVAAGMPNLVRSSWLKPGVAVLDVGTNPIKDPSEEYGYRLIGDVCFEEATSIASAISPVPGGVGPMTVAMLLLNTLESAKRTFNIT